jgi:hypothetical protein
METLVFSEPSVIFTILDPVIFQAQYTSMLAVNVPLLQNFLSIIAFWRHPRAQPDLTEQFVSSGNASYFYPEGA